MRPRNFNTRHYSKQQENRIAKSIGGKRVANSGATAFHKGDVTNDLFLIEAKTHTEVREQFTIKREWIDKNREEAFQMGKHYSALAIDFGDGEQHYLISERLFKYLLDKLREES